MNPKLKNVLKFLLFLSIGITLIWLSLSRLTEQNKTEIMQALRRADYSWLYLSMAIGLLSHLSRAIRWKMLMAPLGHRPGTRNTFFAVMICYLANYALPRLGEVSRCGVLARYEKVPFTESFGTIVVERLVDILTFLLMAVIVFALQFNTVYSFLQQDILPRITNTIAHPSTATYIAGGLFVLFVLVFLFFRKNILSHLGRRTKKFVTGFIDGMTSIRRVKSPVLFIAHSLFIWSIYYVCFHMCFFSLEETAGISLGTGMTAFLIATLTIMFTPGGMGAYPFALASTLVFYQMDLSIGTAIGWFVWLTQFVSIVTVGLLSLILLPIVNRGRKTEG